MQFWPVVLLAGIIAILFAAWLARDVLSQDRGTKAMQEVASLIFEGAMAFLNRQYRTIAVLALAAAVIIGVLIGWLGNDPGHGVRTAIAFLVGAFCSGLAGFIGMYIAVQANLRTAAAAQRSVRDAINVSLRGGAVSGFLVVALSLLGVLGMYAAFGGFNAAATRGDRRPAPGGWRGQRAVRDRRLWLWRLVRRALRPARRRYLYEGGRRRRATSSARSKRVSLRTTRATRRSSPIWLATTSATAPVVVRTCSSRPPPRTSAP